MGGAPSRETLLRSLVREPAAKGCSDEEANFAGYSSTACHGQGGAAKRRPEVVLIPLITNYFPSSACPLFRQFLAVRQEANVLYYYRDARPLSGSPAVLPHPPSDTDSYNFYMSLGERRLVETDSELLALYRARRVFAPVPCAVAFVYNSDTSNCAPTTTAAIEQQEVQQQQHMTKASAAANPARSIASAASRVNGLELAVDARVTTVVAPSVASCQDGAHTGRVARRAPRHGGETGKGAMTIHNTVSLPMHGIRVRIFGFIGDRHICPPSMPVQTAMQTSLDFGLFLSKNAGGNFRAHVTFLAAYTYLTQLQQIGIAHALDPTPTLALAADATQNALIAAPEDRYAAYYYQHEEGVTNEAARQPVDAGLPSASTRSDDHQPGAAQRNPVLLRPVHFTMFASNIPDLCFLRELRARMEPYNTQLNSCTHPKSDDNTGPRRTVRTVLHTVVEGDELKGDIDLSDAETLLWWAGAYYAKFCQLLVGNVSYKLRHDLACRNATENALEGMLYVSSQEPGGEMTVMPGSTTTASATAVTCPRRGDVWIAAHDTVLRAREGDAGGSGLPVRRGTVLRHDGLQWQPQASEFAEDILLSLHRNICDQARRAAPEDAHWVRDATSGLPIDLARGFLLWKDTCAGRTIFYGTTPLFLKKWLRDGVDPVTRFRSHVVQETGGADDDPSLCHTQPAAGMGAMSTAGSTSEASMTVSSRCEVLRLPGAVFDREGVMVVAPGLSTTPSTSAIPTTAALECGVRHLSPLSHGPWQQAPRKASGTATTPASVTLSRSLPRRILVDVHAPLARGTALEEANDVELLVSSPRSALVRHSLLCETTRVTQVGRVVTSLPGSPTPRSTEPSLYFLTDHLRDVDSTSYYSDCCRGRAELSSLSGPPPDTIAVASAPTATMPPYPRSGSSAGGGHPLAVVPLLQSLAEGDRQGCLAFAPPVANEAVPSYASTTPSALSGAGTFSFVASSAAVSSPSIPIKQAWRAGGQEGETMSRTAPQRDGGRWSWREAEATAAPQSLKASSHGRFRWDWTVASAIAHSL